MINTKQYEENIKQIETDEFSTNLTQCVFITTGK